MDDALDNPTRRRLLQCAAQQPDAAWSFIVILAPGVVAGDVVPFTIETAVDTIRMVAGRMTARQALELAPHPAVERIEFDDTARAL